VQRASISRAHAGLSDNMAPLVLLCSAAPDQLQQVLQNEGGVFSAVERAFHMRFCVWSVP
jgi:hypothetical protein